MSRGGNDVLDVLREIDEQSEVWCGRLRRWNQTFYLSGGLCWIVQIGVGSDWRVNVNSRHSSNSAFSPSSRVTVQYRLPLATS